MTEKTPAQTTRTTASTAGPAKTVIQTTAASTSSTADPTKTVTETTRTRTGEGETKTVSQTQVRAGGGSETRTDVIPPPSRECVVDDGTHHTGRAVPGTEICSAHAMRYHNDGTPRDPAQTGEASKVVEKDTLVDTDPKNQEMVRDAASRREVRKS